MANYIKNYKLAISLTIKTLYKSKISSLLHFDFKKTNIFKKRIKSLLKNKNLLTKKNPFKNERIAVYTVLFGDYDSIKNINCNDRNCDFYIITDQSIPKNSKWKQKHFAFPKSINTNVLKNRYLKMHPHLMFPDYKYSLYIDAFLGINFPPSFLLPRLGKNLIGAYSHEETRNCIYDEALTVVKANKDSRTKVMYQIERYKKEGFPKHFGLFENNILLRNHNDSKCVAIMEDWWQEFSNGKQSKRDQLSLMYVIWKHGMTKCNISTLGYGYYDDPMFYALDHNK